MAYAIRKKRNFFESLFCRSEYLATFSFKSDIDYRPNPCGYFAQHITFNTINESIRSLAIKYDGKIIFVFKGFLKNTATYEVKHEGY